MIYPKHFDQLINQQQEEFIAKMPESIKRQHELLFSYRNAIAIYRRSQDAAHQETPDTQADDWTDDLPPSVAAVMKEGREEMETLEGLAEFINSRTLWQEDNDVELQERVRQLMGEKAYQEYRAMDKSF